MVYLIMKKYITPAFDVVAIETESMLAVSNLKMDDTDSGNTDETGTQGMDNNPIWGE